ncbi:spermidine/putrescine ABC transporter substrate-binding protein [Desulfococcaceae bacterium HSG7]|nr:spermidine/putrescine ABC transporter substrate-binding protein [Desulfococcaceae bacterium HSG7]
MRRKNLVTISLALFLFFSMGIFSNILAASKYKDYPVPKECMDQIKKEGATLNIYDWAEWWPAEIFKNFTKEFGVKIVRDHYADTEEMVTKLKLNPSTPYDLILGSGPADAVRLREMGLLKDLNHAWLPNMGAYLKDEYKNLPFDPGNKFQFVDSIFYTTYTYNSKKIKANDPLIGSWGLLFKSKKYKGKITMIDNATECIGAALKYLGYSWNSDVESELMEAKALLLAQKDILAAYDSWPSRLLKDEEVWLSHLWIGDSWLLSREKPEIKGVMPKEGTYYAGNTGFIPKGSKHTAAAHLFINYLYRTEVNVLLVGTIGYPPVHKHTMEFMSDEMKAWPGFIIDKDYQAKCDTFERRLVVGKGKELRDKIWEDIKK